jgi:phage baseplate assembly protein W
MVLYRDLDISFEPNSSGDLSIVSDEAAVSQSIRTLVLTSIFERPFQPSIGSIVNQLLFAPYDNITQRVLAETIKSTITQFEPRATIKFVDFYYGTGPNGESMDTHEILINIGFFVHNRPALVTTSIILRRLR